MLSRARPAYTHLRLASRRIIHSILSRSVSMTHQTFPSDLPVPKDDGACAHLVSFALPALSLPISSNPSQQVDVSDLSRLTILFCYPRSGAPGETISPEWDAIPGARGCTPQACSFNSNLTELKKRGVKSIYGLSTQSSEYQRELQVRTALEYELLSDEHLQFQKALRLPTIEWQGKKLIRRLTLAIEGGVIRKIWYPVFPPDQNVHDVIAWLKSGQAD